ncbi:VOC family protein [candidate division KSB1 bacterium]|nr:VOC family protein [candidate division KSB1 bacterium]
MSDKKVQTAFPLTEIAQVCLIVKDLEKTVENFYHIFGVGPWSFYTYGKPLVKQMTKGGKPAEYKMRVALSNIGPLRIELIQVLEGDSIYQEFIDEHGYGVHHFGLLVDNMQDALQRAENAGFVMIQDGAGFGLDGDGHYAYLNTEDKIGVTLELIERPKRRQKPEKIYPPQKEL